MLSSGILWVKTRCCQEKIRIENKVYHVVQQIAEGGFSFVYLVRDSRGSSFAAKRILTQNESQERAVKWEISVHHLIGDDHPHLMPLLASESISVGRGFSQFVLLFPLFQQSLVDVLISKAKQGTQLEETIAMSWFLAICQGVLVFHELDPPLAHRDIKPHNVLISDRDIPVVMDFGSVTNARVDISTRHNRSLLHEAAAVNSSMSYRAPELWDSMTAEDCVVDERTDCWSLGCLLYAMVFGQGFSPFECSFSVKQSSGRKAKTSRSMLPPIAIPKDCTFLSIIGKLKFPENHSRSQSVVDLITWILDTDTNSRPNLPAIIDRVKASQNQYLTNV